MQFAPKDDVSVSFSSLLSVELGEALTVGVLAPDPSSLTLITKIQPWRNKKKIKKKCGGGLCCGCDKKNQDKKNNSYELLEHVRHSLLHNQRNNTLIRCGFSV